MALSCARGWPLGDSRSIQPASTLVAWLYLKKLILQRQLQGDPRGDPQGDPGHPYKIQGLTSDIHKLSTALTTCTIGTRMISHTDNCTSWQTVTGHAYQYDMMMMIGIYNNTKQASNKCRYPTGKQQRYILYLTKTLRRVNKNHNSTNSNSFLCKICRLVVKYSIYLCTLFLHIIPIMKLLPVSTPFIILHPRLLL